MFLNALIIFKIMEESQKNLQEEIIDFLVKNSNLVLIAILIFGFYLRFKYLNINTAIWWDEGEYLSIAKEWAFGINYEVPSVRQPLVPLLISLLYKIGISNLSIIKFFVVLLPSIASVFLTYLIGKELYNKQIGLISSFIMSVFWVSLFWTTRVSTDLMGLFFSLLAFWSFWKGYIKKENPKLYLSITGIALALGFTTRVGNILTIIIIGIFLIFIARFEIFKNKSLRYLIIFSILVVAPYLIWNQIKFGNIFAFWGIYTKSINTFATPIFWGFFKFFKFYLLNIFFIFFLFGALTYYKAFLGLDILLKKKSDELLADFFIILMILVPTTYFSFILRQTSAEPRWAIVMAPAIFIITAKGFNTLYKISIKYLPEFDYKKIISIIAIITLIVTASLQEIDYSDSLINSKKDSYIQLKLAGEWIKENSDKEDIIMSSAVPQNSYYSERKTIQVTGTEDYFNGLISELKPKFLELTILEGYPEWAFNWPENHRNLVIPVQAYFSDPERTKAVLVIYEFVDYPDKKTNTITNMDTGIEERQ